MLPCWLTGFHSNPQSKTAQRALQRTRAVTCTLHLFPPRTVLELGSGLGLTGVTICRSCRPSRYVFTDCHPNVLQRLKANVRLNGLTDGTTPGVSVEELDWTEATEERLQKINADVVIAAGCNFTFPIGPQKCTFGVSFNFWRNEANAHFQRMPTLN